MGRFSIVDAVSGFRDGLKIRSEKSGEGSTPSRPTFRCFSGLFSHKELAIPDIAKSALGIGAGLIRWHQAILPCFWSIQWLDFHFGRSVANRTKSAVVTIRELPPLRPCPFSGVFFARIDWRGRLAGACTLRCTLQDLGLAVDRLDVSPQKPFLGARAPVCGWTRPASRLSLTLSATAGYTTLCAMDAIS